jgi:hypothetical protein
MRHIRHPRKPAASLTTSVASMTFAGLATLMLLWAAQAPGQCLAGMLLGVGGTLLLQRLLGHRRQRHHTAAMPAAEQPQPQPKVMTTPKPQPQPKLQPKLQPVYMGRQRVGWMDAGGHIVFDQSQRAAS